MADAIDITSCYSEQEARTMQLPDRVWRIPGLLPLGLTVLVAPPKLGKSFLRQQVEHFISAGVPLLGMASGDPVGSLVVDFEGDVYTTRERSFQLDPDWRAERYHHIVYMHRELIPDGFTERMLWLDAQLRTAVDEGRPFGHVALDTLRDFVGGKEPGEDAYTADKRKVTALNQLLLRHGVSGLACHHTNNGAMSLDPYDAINGSTGGIMGGAGACWMLERPQRGQEGVIRGVGRSVRDFEHAVVFRGGRWELTNEITPAQARHVDGSNPRTVLDALAERGGQTVDELVAVTGIAASSVRQYLSRLSRKGEVRKSGEQWFLTDYRPTTEPEPPAPAEPVDLGGGVEWVDDAVPGVCAECGQPDDGGPDQGHLPSCSVLDEPAEPPLTTQAIQVMKNSIVGRRRKVRPLRFVPEAERDHPAWLAAVEADRGVAGGHRFRHEAASDWLDAGDYVVVTLDRNGSYPSACGNVPVFPGPTADLARWSAADDGAPLDVAGEATNEAGVFRVSWSGSDWHDVELPHPAGVIASKEGGDWITAPTLRALRKAGVPAKLHEAWTGPANTGLFLPFADWVKERREATRGTDDYDLVKRATSIAIRLLHPEQARSPFWRPDWHAAVVAEANTRHWIMARKAHDAGFPVVALRNTDEVSILLGVELPIGSALIANWKVTPWLPESCPYKLGTAYGQVKIKDVVTLAEWVDGGRAR